MTLRGLNLAFFVRKVARSSYSSGIGWNIHLADVLKSALILPSLPILLPCTCKVPLSDCLILNLTRLNWWIEAVDLLWNWLYLRVSRVTWFIDFIQVTWVCEAFFAYTGLVLLNLLILAVVFVNWFQLGPEFHPLFEDLTIVLPSTSNLTLDWWRLVQLAWRGVWNLWFCLLLQGLLFRDDEVL